MAAARGDNRRRPGSVFTVQSANCGPPGPCRDGLNSSRVPLNSSNAYTSATTNIHRDGIAGNFPRNELSPTLSRDGSRDALAEVRVHADSSERCQSPPLQEVNGNF